MRFMYTFFAIAMSCLICSCSYHILETQKQLNTPQKTVPTASQIPSLPRPIFHTTLTIDVPTDTVSAVAFTVQPKPGAQAKPIHVEYALARLKHTKNTLELPVWGLYSQYKNRVIVTIIDNHGKQEEREYTIETDPYVDPKGIYDKIVTIQKNRTPLSYSYFLIKSNQVHLPIVMDIDGEVRWAHLEPSFDAISSLFYDQAIYTHYNNKLIRTDWDGHQTNIILKEPNGYSHIKHHHNLEEGKVGLLAEVDVIRTADQVSLIESVIFEVDPQTGETLAIWDLNDIFKKTMRDAGDDPSEFVRDEDDWCHINSAIYDRKHDSLIVSCRENFIASIDYETQKVEWLFGDLTKKWYQYPSLAALALKTKTLYPIGQHALSMDQNVLTFFNNGLASKNHMPKGARLKMSQPSQYELDLDAKTATRIWRFMDGKLGAICSSVYQDRHQDYLISYSVDKNVSLDNPYAYIIGVSGQTNLKDKKAVLFEYRFLNMSKEGISSCSSVQNVTILDELTHLKYE